ncbi:PD40 domain-containing protein [Nocardioides cavernae]|uniref:PD40 domain-containing protein n=1 Tax=Nocardioides cavernae TaxID=1921566 RepID=A0ABR8NA90_9ACTN|nr:PD40 domain-containing protein [Nocardioides cavernae]MBD3925059.1 PD40 domain-containing protein [Nocardioides cavernae]MBM7514567.1 Tol biopolymer transport system component [Nocardioides cavernae]
MSSNLQDLFDEVGRNAPAPTLDPDDVLRRARRSRHRRISGVVAATVVVAVALVVGLASQRQLGATPDPATPLPTAPVLGTLGRLAYAIDGDVYVADAHGRNRIRIADGTPGVDGNCPGYWGEGPIWSPDGRYLAYRGDPLTAGDTPAPDCLWNRNVTISDASGDRLASFPGDGWAVAWSPDSTRVAAWVDFYGEHTLGIYGLDGVRQALLDVPSDLMTGGDWDPVWSPDGAWLLGPGGLVIPVDGSPPRTLPEGDPRSYGWYAYSPGGAAFAYISPDGLGVAAADGSRARVLVRGGLGNAWWSLGPVWSPTGDRIAFVSVENGENELAVLDVASGTVGPLADMGGHADTVGSIITFSPEGDRILFVRRDPTGERGSLWSVNTDGSEPHRLVPGSGWGDWQTLVPTR